ncbi:hypothetical protein [Legionella septentrionalis]|uniref:Uncharacterized protein n=1 Tax=Legionella septentrionalis TaxID=2498109 RepID=A0A3S0V4H4_9GAMM|nr:hypothetical protein [Legionella septentrionalis]RUQ81511.1 hypothetical protein EKM59_10480 [Legionella septentrionalis]
MKPLIETNPYLKNKEQREASNNRSTRSSCGVEGIVMSPSFSISIDSSRAKKGLEKIKTRLRY